MKNSLLSLDTFDPETKDLNVVIETPRGSRNKYDYDEQLGAFKLAHVLAEGLTFPNEFGFIPSTLAEDGDPLDVMVLLDEPTSVGCVLTARPIGVIEAKQTEVDGTRFRNDRLIAVATHAHVHSEVKALDDLDKKVIDEIEHFFIYYNERRGKKFKPLGRFGPKRAMKLIAEAQKAYKKKNKS
ncbi:MAG TPA: inorganic diphosphatase, partial [Candidatus Binataceae bacterium]|nr:inorganic diphosphatase [Candidatus Binataceae bacterium]